MAAIQVSLPDGLEVRGERPEDREDEDVLDTSATTGTNRGRGLFATRSFAPGELIGAFREPLFVLPASAQAATVCNYCLDARKTAKVCTGCRTAAYCGSGCQRAHWGAVHRLECRVLAEAKKGAEEAKKAGRAKAGSVVATAATLPTSVRALVQLLLRWKAVPAVQAAVAGLGSHAAAVRKQTPALWEDMAMQAVAACTLAGWGTRPEDAAGVLMAAETLCKIHTNAFDRSDADVGDSGTFLDPGLAMANHSCVPNAVVVFAGRAAFLRAEQAVQAGDEVTISYVDYTKPKAARQAGLAPYRFVCRCRRCADDVDVYGICAESPLVPLNAFSFVPDTEELRHPHVNRSVLPSSAAIDAIYAACRPEDTVAPADRLDRLRASWAACQPLVRADAWAVEPLGHVLQQAIVWYSEQQRFVRALAVECFVLLHSDPFQYVAPFAQWRLKGLLLVAKTITNTPPGAESAEMAEITAAVEPALAEPLGFLADGSLYEAILLMVLHYGPQAHSEEWALLAMARDLLRDVQSVPDRELLSAALRHWIEDPTEPAAAHFFREHILSQVRSLASLAIGFLQEDLGGEAKGTLAKAK